MMRSIGFLSLSMSLWGSAGCASAPSPADPSHAEGHGEQGEHGDHDGHKDHTHAPLCAEIAKVCHGADGSTGVAHDCHMLGHNPATTGEQCEARHHECMAACGGGAAPAGSVAPVHP